MSEKNLVQQFQELLQQIDKNFGKEILVLIPAIWQDKHLVPKGIDNEVIVFKARKSFCQVKLTEWIDEAMLFPVFFLRSPFNYKPVVPIEELELKVRQDTSWFWLYFQMYQLFNGG